MPEFIMARFADMMDGTAKKCSGPRAVQRREAKLEKQVDKRKSNRGVSQ